MLSVNVSNSNTNVDWFVEETLTLLAETRRNSCKVIVSSDFDLYIVDESYFRNGLFFLSNKMLWCTSKTHKNDTLTVWFVSPQILSLCFLKETLYNFYQIFFNGELSYAFLLRRVCTCLSYSKCFDLFVLWPSSGSCSTR